MNTPTTPGIYCFWNKISNKVYVGSSNNILRYNTADKASGGCIGTKENHKKLCAISSQLTDAKSSLFIKLEGKIYYLEYINQSLQERAEILGRSIEKDLSRALAFKPEITVEC